MKSKTNYNAVIVKFCHQIDEIAKEVFIVLGNITRNSELKHFWLSMSTQEELHVEFWKSIEKTIFSSHFPNIFPDPASVIKELRISLKRSNELLRRCEKVNTDANAFLLAYRLEFYMLHPAFGMLFHTMGISSNMSNPEEAYNDHINQFVKILTKYSNETPELELLSSLLNRVWIDNKMLAAQATHDELTGLFNRRGFDLIVNQYLELAYRNKSTIGMLMIDVDNFKEINDKLGHYAGDLVLKEVATAISRSLRKSDVIARFGGDEFIVFIPNVDKYSISILSNKILKRASIVSLKDFSVSVSIGGVEIQINQSSLIDIYKLMHTADIALLQAKNDGKNRFYIDENS
ncbi:MAG: GGDEF domain-containing protein [Planctomycetota bacterium]